jgi:UDP-N-acetylglucosamine 2-epimerase (non-hydrolysing)
VKISVIFGTRPEAIKLAPVILALRKDPRFCCQVCVTAQHREMLDQVLEVFGIRPDVDLNLMRPSQSLAGLTVRALEALDGYLATDRPDLVLVQGDTTTVLCAALAAFYRRVPFGHVEAGLRTGNLQAPWPEEANRVLASRLAALHFAPTESARRNLLGEGVPDRQILVTGNPVIDALFLALERVRKNPPWIPGLPATLQPLEMNAAKPASPDGKEGSAGMVLITGHRRENFGAGFESICKAIGRLAVRFPDFEFVYAVHLNPSVREPVFRILNVPTTAPESDAARRGNIHLIEPVPYLSFVTLMERATIILTDSGGIQEEAPSLGKPVLVMRDTTERPEALTTGLVKLVGTDYERIVSEATTLLQASVERTSREDIRPGSTPHHPNPYGDGKAADRIVAGCAEFLTRCIARP